MGNEKPSLSTKYLVLSLLRSKNALVSGEELAAFAGVSRVSIWKAVQSLQEAGYGIRSEGKGYVLECDLQDALYPWEFAQDQKFFRHYTQTESTMDQARVLAVQEKTSFIVTADVQTKGRGRRFGAQQKKWQSEKGGLFFTLVSHPVLPLAATHRLVMAAQISLVQTLNKLKPQEQFYVRWPNDIWNKQGKVAGVLDEAMSSGSMLEWLNVGVGVNLEHKPQLEATSAVQGLARRKVLQEFRSRFFELEPLTAQNDGSLAALWNRHCPDTGASVRLVQKKNMQVFTGINSYGWAEFNSGISLPPGEDSFIKK